MPETQEQFGRYVWSEVEGAVDVLGRYLGQFDGVFPLVPQPGQECFRIDFNAFYKYSGTDWVPTTGFYLGNVAEFPVTVGPGQEVYRTDLGAFFKYTGAEWLEI